MLTTGIIREINLDSENHKGNKYKVEISLFKIPGDTKEANYVYLANCSVPGGMYNSYVVGDKVYIDFLNNNQSLPIIIGKIYQGLEEENRSYAYLNSLNVKEEVKLPVNTTIGDITYENLKHLFYKQAEWDAGGTGSAGGGALSVICKGPCTNLYGYNEDNYSYINYPDYYQILYHGTTRLTDSQMVQYMLYMTGSSRLPSDRMWNIYNGGFLFTDGTTCYPLKVGDQLRLVKVTKSPFTTEERVKELIEEYLNPQNLMIDATSMTGDQLIFGGGHSEDITTFEKLINDKSAVEVTDLTGNNEERTNEE